MAIAIFQQRSFFFFFLKTEELASSWSTWPLLVTPFLRQRIPLIGACITISTLLSLSLFPRSMLFHPSRSPTPISEATFSAERMADRLKNVARRLIGREKLRRGSVLIPIDPPSWMDEQNGS